MQDLRWPVENSSGWVPWASKHDKAFWRGASTGKGEGEGGNGHTGGTGRKEGECIHW